MGNARASKTAALVAVNSHIFAAATTLGEDLPWEFFCECGDAGCTAHVELRLASYKAIHDAGGAVLAPGHESAPIEPAVVSAAESAAFRAQASQAAERARENQGANQE